jgi:predicted MPP superfamily phosphohydrolase
VQIGTITRFEWNHLDVAVPSLTLPPLGLRILHVSDLHVRPRWLGSYDRLIESLQADPPDLIAITGDFVEHRADYRSTLPVLRRLLSLLKSRLGVFGILGNHDGDLLGPRLEDWGVHVICGRLARVKHEEFRIEFAGIPSVSREDVRSRKLDFIREIGPIEPGVPRLVLSHFPDSILHFTDLEAHIVLAGHTHGGQVCLPGGIPIITHDALPRAMCRGAHRVGGRLLVVNRGMGFASVPMRLFCPPEVIELRLVASLAQT